MKTILVPIDLDYSKPCSNTLLYALNLARMANLQVVVFHAFTPVVAAPGYFSTPGFLSELEKDKAMELEAFVAKTTHNCPTDIKLKFSSTFGAENERIERHPLTKSGFHVLAEHQEVGHHKQVPIICVCKAGATEEQILTVSSVYDADLIVMGIPGLGAKSQPYFGNTTLWVMRHSNIPVMAIPKAIRFSQLHTIVFASDLHKIPDPLLLHKLRDLVVAFRLKLQVLHLHHNPDAQDEYEHALPALEVLDRQLFDIDFNVTFLRRTDIDYSIQEFMLEQKADILMLSPNLHGFADKLLNKSLTQRMITKAFVPLLAMPTTTEKTSRVKKATKSAAPNGF